MDLLNNLLISLAANVASQGARDVYEFVIGFIRKTVSQTPGVDLAKMMNDLARLPADEIRRRVQEHTHTVPLTSGQRERLTNLLINLSQGARFHTTHGSPTSSFLRTERAIEQLLSNIQPKRQTGEVVGPGAPDWHLHAFLGMGSFGEVWEGRSELYPHPRAFKFFTSKESKEWLHNEQKTLYEVKARLGDHPNIINFIDVKVAKQPYPFLELEYAGGGSLEDWILRRDSDRARLDKQEIMEGIIRGVSRAHAVEICHCDLKPANILLTDPPDVQAKVGDFGLGRVQERQPAAKPAGSSSDSAERGTEMYRPPEAMERFAERDPFKDDVFALGVIWYQLTVEQLERPPYDFAERLQEAGLDSHTIRVISRCLAQPKRRFANARELEDAVVGLPPSFDWPVPEGCFDVQYLARGYLSSQLR